MAAETATFVAGDDGELSVVDFGVPSSTELGAVDLRPQDLFPSSGGDGTASSASSDSGPLLSAEEEEEEEEEEEVGSPSHQLDLPSLPGVEPVGGVDDPRAPVFPPAAGRRVVVVAVRVDFHAGREAMRLAAFLLMLVAAMPLIGDPDASRSSQFRALMVWFGGCILLFLLRH